MSSRSTAAVVFFYFILRSSHLKLEQDILTSAQRDPSKDFWFHEFSKKSWMSQDIIMSGCLKYSVI